MTETQLALPFQRQSRTSRAAATSMADRAPSIRDRILVSLRQSPATDLELEERLSLKGSTVRPARIALTARGLLRASECTRTAPSGREATVWEAV